ncbi:MAG: M4 family metallopeptidase [Bacteroidetes bacterium]|nr:M4 family metallopeptidase [Bacteroidota bacterium]
MKRLLELIKLKLSPHCIIIIAIMATGFVQAQTNRIHTTAIDAIAKPGHTENWVDFRDDVSLNALTLFVQHAAAFNLGANDKMKLVKTETDELGFTHNRYQQFYKNVKVMYGEYIIHSNPQGEVQTANGRLLTGLNTNTTASLNETEALQLSLQFMNAKKYLWENTEIESALKVEKNDERATYYPKGELALVPAANNGSFLASDYRLAWTFKIYTDDHDVIAKLVCVDANTGAIIHSNAIAMECSAGSGASAFNGSVTVNTRYSFPIGYYSHNDCQTTDLYVYNCNGGGAANNLYLDGDNTWTNASAVQAQWGIAMVNNYFTGEHGRNSWDGNYGNMIAYNNAYAGSNNACWGCTGNSTIYYAGSTAAATDDWNTNDIMGHEFAHGVTQATAGLVYSYESGALNESFSDIFGEMVESWSEGNCDYLVGADRGAIRSFTNPNSYSQPDTYLGTLWYTGTGDNGGVHYNSGVQNRFFHLLSEGGSGTTDFGVAYNVSGISRFKARQIMYRALAFYLTSSSQYIDARAASLHAAWDLYGQCSNEIIQVGNAWQAVGVESQSWQFNKNVCGIYPASGTFIQAISILRAADGCATTITPSASTVYFTARDNVYLKPGFIAQAGSNFVAYLEPCSSTMWKAANTDAGSDAEKGLVPISENNTDTRIQSEKALYTIAPNPITNEFTLTLDLTDDALVEITLYNILGNTLEVLQHEQQTQTGNHQLHFNIGHLSQGVYMLDVKTNGQSMVQKITKL